MSKSLTNILVTFSLVLVLISFWRATEPKPTAPVVVTQLVVVTATSVPATPTSTQTITQIAPTASPTVTLGPTVTRVPNCNNNNNFAELREVDPVARTFVIRTTCNNPVEGYSEGKVIPYDETDSIDTRAVVYELKIQVGPSGAFRWNYLPNLVGEQICDPGSYSCHVFSPLPSATPTP